MKRSRRRGGRHWARRWTGAEAGEFLSGWRESGQPLAVYCRRQGVEYERVRRWRSKLSFGGEAHPVALPLKPVRVVADPEPEGPIGGAPMEVALTGGRCVRVRSGFDAEELVRLVVALEGV